MREPSGLAWCCGASQPLAGMLVCVPGHAIQLTWLIGSSCGSTGLVQVIVAGWLIQTAKPLTAAQINGARQVAAATGMAIETKNDDPSLNALRNWSTAAGILLALGVLVMTVGLIRSETAGDLRTLTATGASRRTRRTITGATAGALGLLGAVLGTAAAYLAAFAFFRSQLSERMGHPPVLGLTLILIGLPVVAGVGGWLFAGREPQLISRKPIE